MRVIWIQGKYEDYLAGDNPEVVENKDILGSDGYWYCNVLIENDLVQDMPDGYMQTVYDATAGIKINGKLMHNFSGYVMPADDEALDELLNPSDPE